MIKITLCWPIHLALILMWLLVGCATPQPRGVTCAESRALVCMNTNRPAPPLYGCKPTRAYPIKPEGMEVCL